MQNPAGFSSAADGEQTPRVLLADDDPKILEALRRALTLRGYEVATAADGQEALQRFDQARPDLVILDIMMPGLNGIQVCQRLKARSDVPILMLTALDDVHDRVAGLEAGADDYLVKPFALEELIARVRALLRRLQKEQKPQKGTEALRFADLAVDTAAREVQRGGRVVEMTPREYDLVVLFLQHPRQVLTREQILERVWGFDTEVETHVLEVYIGYLRQKLEAGGEKRLIHTVRGTGYMLKEG